MVSHQVDPKDPAYTCRVACVSVLGNARLNPKPSHKIREIAPSTKIIILTMDDALADQVRKARVHASVSKGSIVSDLQDAITCVLIDRTL
jgi:DNA-binding NarL/FixJ family response regulator